MPSHNQAYRDALVEHTDEPDITAISRAWEEDRSNASGFISQCEDAYNQRRCWWPGKNRQQKKTAPDAMPWQGASDQEVPVIDEKINAYVAKMMTALSRSHVRAYPVEANDVVASGVTTNFLKWLITSNYIPNRQREFELAANYMLEKSMAVTYVNWRKKHRRHIERFSLEDIAAESPELRAMLEDEEYDDQVVTGLQAIFPELNKRRGKKIIRDLRTTGEAEFPVVKEDVSRPLVETKAPDMDVYWPNYVMDIQRSPRVHLRFLLTPQEIKQGVVAEGWDEDWADFVIAHAQGQTDRDFARYGNQNTGLYDTQTNESDLIEVIYTMQRLIDSDGAEGIYQTIWCPHAKVSPLDANKPFYAQYELLSGYDQYPLVVTPLMRTGKRLYDVRTICDMLRGNQRQSKITRDGWADMQSLIVSPPLFHPMGRPPEQWGAGAWVGRRQPQEFEYAPVPDKVRDSVEIEQFLQLESDRIVGLGQNAEPEVQQFFINKFLEHINGVIQMVYKAYQRFGPDELFFRVTGVPDPQVFKRGHMDEELDIKISFDSQMTDPDTMESQWTQMAQLLSLDRTGRISVDRLIEFKANLIDPAMADAILPPEEQGTQETVKHVTEDLTSIYAGIAIGARPNGAETALQVIQQYMQQPDIAARYQQDEAFRTRLDTYMQQYQFQLQQAQNAQTGRLGTEPAQFQGVNTQGQ